MKFRSLASILALASLLVTGCNSTALTQSLAQGAVTYGVIKVVRNNPDRAVRIIAIAAAVRGVAGQEQFDTVALLDAYIRSRVDWSKLPPEDTALAVILLDAIKAALEEKIGTGQIAGGKLLVVAEVAGWIETAARAVPPATGLGT